MFSEISQNSQENTCARVSLLIKFQGSGQSLFFNKVTGLRPATLLKKRLWHRCFPVSFVKFLRKLFLHSTSGRLLLSRTWDLTSQHKIGLLSTKNVALTRLSCLTVSWMTMTSSFEHLILNEWCTTLWKTSAGR